MSLQLEQQLTILAQQLTAKGWRVTAAESCTGGGIAAAFTSLAGSSNWFEYGFVSYANKAKTELLSVPEQTLDTHGAVSQATVEAMVSGAIRASNADIGVAVSGIAGPDGATPDKPVGTVWLAWQQATKEPVSHCFQFSGSRAEVREQAILEAICGLNQLLIKNN